MDWKKLALVLTTASSLALVGCGDDDNGGGGGGDPDAGPGAEDPFFPEVLEPPATSNCEAEGETLFYVVSELDFGQLDAATGETAGFNVDGYNTPPGGTSGCGHMDGRYDVNQDGVIEGPEEGIDNQLAPLTDILAGALNLQDEVASGSILILVKLEGVTDYVNDTCVKASLLLAEVPEGAELDTDDNGHVLPGQTFNIDPASYDEETGEPLVEAEGVLVDGRLLIGPVTIRLEIPFDDNVVALTIINAQVAFTLGNDNNLEVGLIGGGIDADGLLTELDPAIPDIDLSSFAPTIAMYADLLPDADNENCEAISLALTFGAVDAVVEEEEEEEVIIEEVPVQ